MDAYRVQVEWEENGCYLHLTHDEYGPLAVPVEPEQAYDAIKAGIGPWLREREEAYRALMAEAQKHQALADAAARKLVFACDPDESGGYDLSDSKHPDFHSVHADHYDAREGK